MTNDEIISLVLNAFNPISAIHTDGAAADTDTVLFVVPDSNNNLVGGKMPASVLRAYLTKALNPTINSSGYWVIGSTVTSIKAEGVTPLIRRGTNGIEASTDKGATYNTVALWSDLRPDFAGMSAEEKAAFKFNYSDFTAEEIAALQKPATDAAALVDEHITMCDAARDAANTAAASANAAATLATTQANRCKAFSDNPIKIQSGTWWVYDEASSAYKDTGVSPANYVLTKSEVERVLVGAITSHTHAYLPLAGGAMANTNLVTNLNADMLDGYHATDFLHVGGWWNVNDSHNANSLRNSTIFAYQTHNSPAAGILIDFSNSVNTDYGFQLSGAYNALELYFRNRNNGSHSAWKRIAFEDGNVASATKLQTPRTIWGQSFDGTNDVNGIIHTAASITTLNNHVNRDLAFFDGAGSVGTFAIKLPANWNNSMNMYRIMIYEYSGNGASEILLGGFNYSGQYFATKTAAVLGRYDKAIRFASDGSNTFILLGNSTTNWDHVKVFLDTVYTHKISEEWMSGYSIALITDESQFTYLTDDLPRNNIHVTSIDCQYNAYIGGELHVRGATLLDSTLTCSGLITARLGVRVSNGSQSVDLTVGSDGLLYAGGKAVQVAA